MIYNDNLIKNLRAIIDSLLSRKEKIPKELENFFEFCNTRVNAEDFKPHDFQKLFDACNSKLVEMARGGYLYFEDAKKQKDFFTDIGFFSSVIINSRKLINDYNSVVVKAMPYEKFASDHKIIFVGIANLEERQANPKSKPVFVVRGDGLYIAVHLAGSIYGMLPRIGIEFSDYHYGPYDMGRIFECKGYNPDLIFIRLLARRVALFRHVPANNEWQLRESGIIEVSKWKKKIPTPITKPQQNIDLLANQVRLLAHGGTHFGERRRIGNWPAIPSGTLEDLYALPQGTINFGVGELEGKKFIILRERQNVQNRGGYAYTLLLDPSEAIWAKAKWNAAIIVRNILNDRDLRYWLMEKPDDLTPTRLGELVLKLLHSDWSVTPTSDGGIQRIWTIAERSNIPILIGSGNMEKPIPEKLAQALAALPESLRRNVTWLIGGGSVQGRYFGSRIVWDPRVGVGLLAYGGNAYVERRRVGDWPDIPLSAFQDFYGLEADKISFGVGELREKRFIILRQHQKISKRGGYPYTLLFDPGEIIWRKANRNAAVIIRNILNDQELRYLLLEMPEEIHPEKLIAIISKLLQSDWSVNSSYDSGFLQLWKTATSSSSILLIGPQYIDRPTPESWAQLSASLPQNLKDLNLTWFIGGGQAHGRAFGLHIVWDPNYKPVVGIKK